MSPFAVLVLGGAFLLLYAAFKGGNPIDIIKSIVNGGAPAKKG